jgi:signal transduction histidine kinase
VAASTGTAGAAPLPALVAHDVKNALGVLELQLATLADDPDPKLARAAHAQCVALRQRLVMMLTLYPTAGWSPVSVDDDATGMPLLRSDESPIDFLCSVQRRTPRPRRDVELTVGAGLGAPACWTFDPHLVRLALDAALHNAWRYARRHIHLDARGEPGYLVFTVTDDGPGPTPAAMRTGPAAQPAARPRPARDAGLDDAGTGLGTALCDAVARAHGSPERPGCVSLQPVRGGGACFELWLA